MLQNVQIAVIGGGVMGSAIVRGVLQKGLVKPKRILITDPRDERLAELQQSLQVRVSSDNLEAADWGQFVIFAVKPQNLTAVLPPLRRRLRPDAVCLSIVAGTPIDTFVDYLEHRAVVRSISNTPAQIGEGMTVWTAAPEVNEQQRSWVQAVLSSLGHERFVEDEDYLDMATAIAGSGPAYIFLILEALIDAGVHLGFARPLAEELALQTMYGSLRYAQESQTHPALLRNAVTSPGGTTAAGLSELERGHLRSVLSNAVWAAYNRSRELGRAVDS